MSEHLAVVHWKQGGAVFTDGRYSRKHTWCFDEGVEIVASASPHVVPAPFSVSAAVDPEEGFVASLSSCHMLWFLSIAAGRGYVVDAYRDEPVGEMARDEGGRLWMARVTLRPQVTFSGAPVPGARDVAAVHHAAHEACYIARSVRTEVRVEPAGGQS